MIKVCINTLTSQHVPPEKQDCDYFKRKKLKTLSTWQEWNDGETKQLDQFYTQEMFRDPIDSLVLPDPAVILCPYWQYAVK